MAGDSNITNKAPKAASVRAMTSAYGRRIPLVYGRARVQANVIYYTDFIATESKTKTKSGGKGGGGVTQTNINYTYNVCVLFALCEGEVSEVSTVWAGKQKGSLSEFGLSSFPGSGIQSALGYISTKHPIEAIPYRYTSYIGSGNFYLGDNPSISNINAEVRGRLSNVNVLSTESLFTDEMSSIPAAPYQLTAVPPQSGTWLSNVAVQYEPFGDGSYSPMVQVASSPGPGQYSVAAGVYTFNSVDGGNPVVLTYQYSVGTGDANPADVIYDLIVDPKSCLGLSLGLSGLITTDANSVRTYCQAMGVYVSPVYTEAKPARDMIKSLCDITNTAVYFSEGRVKFVALCDKAITSAAATFTPDLTPAYAITTDDILDDGAITITRKAQDDCYNTVNVNYQNRAIEYNDDVQVAFDQANIERFGLRPMPDLNYPEIVSAGVARLVGQQAIQRSNAIKATYEFKLGWQYSRLEPTDILTITDTSIGLVAKPVRILQVDEDDDGIYIRAEELLIGSIAPPRHSTQESDGYLVDYNISPGSVNEPFIFNPPPSLTGSPEIWMALSGSSTNWGGCNVWISDDDATYKLIGTQSGPARHGETTNNITAVGSPTTPDTTNTISLTMFPVNQTLDSATTEAAQSYETLIALRRGVGVNGNVELISYRDSTLTGANAYDISYLFRGLYGSEVVSGGATKWARLDNMIFKYKYDPDLWLGKTMYFKFQPYNIYGSSYEDLGSVGSVSYYIPAAAVGTPFNLRLAQPFVGDSVKWLWDPVRGADKYEVSIRNSANTITYRTVEVYGTDFEYTWQDSKSDGGPYRTVRIYVRAMASNGNGAYAFLESTNPTPIALTGVSVTGGFGVIFGKWNPSPETDAKGYVVYMSATSGFTPGSGNLLTDTATNEFSTRTLPGGAAIVGGTTYYFRIGAYDTYSGGSFTGVILSSELSATVLTISGGIGPGEITGTMIADGTLAMTEFASGIRPPRVVTTLPTIDGTVYKNQDLVTLTTDGKLYRAVSGSWTAVVPAADITGTLTNAQIADLAAAKITGQLTNSQLADIAAAKISGQLTNSQLADIAASKVTGTLTNAQIADLAATKITGQITSTQITDNAITSAKINAGAIVAGKIAADAVTANEIAANAITSAKINAGAIVAGKLAANAVTAGTIAANAVTATEISAGSITTAKIAANAVTASEIAANAVTATQINAGAVTTAKIAANAVTANEIASNAITAVKIDAGAVTTAKLAAGAVTANEIAANTITAAKIVSGTITATQIAAAGITGDRIAANTITGDRIAANTIVAGNIAANTITATQIAAGTITATQIAASTITTDKIVVGAVTASTLYSASHSVTFPSSAVSWNRTDTIGSFTSTGVAANITGTVHIGCGDLSSFGVPLVSGMIGGSVECRVELVIDSGSPIILQASRVIVPVVGSGSLVGSMASIPIVWRGSLTSGSRSIALKSTVTFRNSSGSNTATTGSFIVASDVIILENKV
jgi:hypothetical protein